MENSSILQQPSTKNHGQLLVVAGYYAFRNLRCKRLQLDEMWAWIYCKEKNRTEEIARKQPDAGDVWLWVAVDADSKLVASWRLGQRDLATATDFVNDLARRVKGRVQITTDALRTYVNVIEDAFGTEADYAQLHKVYRAPMENETRYSPARCIGCSTKDVSGNHDPKHISTSFVVRQNWSVRTSMRRYTRLSNGFSRKLENHEVCPRLLCKQPSFVFGDGVPGKGAVPLPRPISVQVGCAFIA